MKKILLVSTGDPRSKKVWSGVEHSIYLQLTKYYDVDIMTMNHIQNARLLDTRIMKLLTWKKQTTPFGLYDSYLRSKRISAKLEDGHYDAAFVFDCPNMAFLHTATPVVYYTDTTMHLMQHYYWTFRWPLYWAANVIQRRCLKNSDRILVASNWAIRDMTSHYRISPAKCRLCRVGANVTPIHHGRDYRRLGTTVKLVFVGIGWERKGGDDALDAFRRLKTMDSSRQYELHVIGSTPDRRANDEGIRWYGRLNRDTPEEARLLTKIFMEGDVFLLPTRAECAGIVFCEASAYGLPIVTRDTGGIGDYVVNGVNGFRLPVEATGEMFADCILRIVSDTSLIQRLSDGGRKLYVECLNWDAAGKTVKETIDSLCFLDEK